MSGKFNWDRVRKEKLAREHGSDWVTPEFPFEQSEKKKRRKEKRAGNQKTPIIQHRIASGAQAPCSRLSPVVDAATELSLGEFAAAIKGIHQSQTIAKSLLEISKKLRYDRTSTIPQKKAAEQAISAMLRKFGP